MAVRTCFFSTTSTTTVYNEKKYDFTYHCGVSKSQKQKSIASLHGEIRKEDPGKRILEVSSKSCNPLGVALSAFNLQYQKTGSTTSYPMECVYQAAKTFEYGGPYDDLLQLSPWVAKKDVRLRNSGKLLHFSLDGTIWGLSPQTMFYDWLYISSLLQNEAQSREVLEYEGFTDIEYNHEKSIACQARSAAIYVSLVKSDRINSVMENHDSFSSIYIDTSATSEQISMFDK